MNKQDFTDYKNMVNGPSHFEFPFPKGKAIGVSRTGLARKWNGNLDDLVALNITEHDFETDLYMFVLIDDQFGKGIILGWIFFDELLEKSTAFLEDETVYLTVPIKRLRSMEEINEDIKMKGGE